MKRKSVSNQNTWQKNLNKALNNSSFENNFCQSFDQSFCKDVFISIEIQSNLRFVFIGNTIQFVPPQYLPIES